MGKGGPGKILALLLSPPSSQLEFSRSLHPLILFFGFPKFYESVTISNVNIDIFLLHFLHYPFLYCLIGRCLNGSLLPNIYSI